MSKQAVNDLLRQLESKGYLTLEPDPTDGRARRIALTPRGSALMECIRAAAQEVAADWERAVGRERFAQVRQTLLDYVAAEDRSPNGDSDDRTRARIPAGRSRTRAPDAASLAPIERQRSQ
jgi:hypothetical protein